ncbi:MULTISPECIES: hypothetical protein [unclassified Streptomyces]|uniref:hypothetical protein n=1 Tax=unclassified Streptomyces TaxID=2593676 RepID=UPI00081DEB3D|nr:MULTISPECIES: hypothetical protein [unclassified Streptomyces]MYR93598.1 hypothetical protein [Streptomyces sp. SID4937]SCD55810.1 cAMP-binding domain of CRP or a regulatory subunit of cAMP-dependent protein kinases [Streptomyces sp. ScaeMP-e83]
MRPRIVGDEPQPGDGGETVSGTTLAEFRNGPGPRVLSHYFLQQGVPQDAADELARFSSLVRHQRSVGPEPISSQYIEFVLFGTVLVNGRIWGGNYILGNLDLFTDVPSLNRLEQIEFLSATRTVRIARGALRSIAVRKLPVVRMIHQRLMTYVQEFEDLYGMDHLKPIHRVARLLNHLAYQQDLGAEIVIGALDPSIITGPTQRHFAHALGLGVSTVEKALRELRDHELLAETSTGSRLNRTYRVVDHIGLRTVGNGADLPQLDL